MATTTLTMCVEMPRHVDPYKLEDEGPYPKSLVMLYSKILLSISTEEWNRAKANLMEAYTVHAPKELKFIVTRFNDLLNKTQESLRRVRGQIDEASNFTEWADLDEAEVKIEGARVDLAESNRTTNELVHSAIQLSDKLKFTPQTLLEKIADLRALISEYGVLIEQLIDRLSEYRRKSPVETVLTIKTEAKEVKVGSEIKVEGKLLTDEGEPLPKRKVKILIDDEEAGTQVTDSNGNYVHTLKIPYIYKKVVTIQSKYGPEGGDYGTYAPAASEALEIQILYGEPELDVEAPEAVYPSLKFWVIGWLNLNGEPLKSFTVKIAGLGVVEEATTDDVGRFVVSIQTPSDTSSGYEIISFETVPNGTIGPAHKNVTVEVTREVPQLLWEVPQIALSGSSISLKGKVTLNGVPIKGCEVDVKMGDLHSSVTTGDDGTFKMFMDVPLFVPTMRYSVTIHSKPKEAWIAQKTGEVSIFILNLAGLFTLTLLFGGALFLALPKTRLKSSRDEEPSGVEEGWTSRKKNLLLIAPSIGKSQGIEAIYYRALKAVSTLTGIGISRSHTIREYLKAVRSALKRVYGVFERLSLMYERWLYGPPNEKTDRKRIEALLHKLLKVIGLEG